MRVSWYLDATNAPVPDARLIIEAGRVVEVTTQSHPDEVDLRPWVAVPPLVNAHTHLEFSDCRSPIPAGKTFPDWIRQTVATRRASERDVGQVIRAGITESAASGVRTLGEIATSDASLDALDGSHCGAVVFRELIGLTSSAVDARLQTAQEVLGRFHGPSVQDLDSEMSAEVSASGSLPSPDLTERMSAASGCYPGLSPHAPYSVHPELLHAVTSLAVKHQVPVAMHLAETREELELLASGSGPFRTMLEEFGVWDEASFPGGRTIRDILEELRVVEQCLVIHGNYLSESEQDLIAGDRRFSVVVCPRTHRHFHHSPHPWRSMWAAGARILVGTDGRGSNPDLNLWHDLHEMHTQYSDVPASSLLRMVTVDALEGLGLGSPDSGSCDSMDGGSGEGLTLIAVRDLTDPDAGLFAGSSRVGAVIKPAGSDCRIEVFEAANSLVE